MTFSEFERSCGGEYIFEWYERNGRHVGAKGTGVSLNDIESVINTRPHWREEKPPTRIIPVEKRDGV